MPGHFGKPPCPEAGPHRCPARRPGERENGEDSNKLGAPARSARSQPAASVRVACCKRDVTMVLRWIFDGFQGFLPLLLQSLLLAHPPCQPPFLHFSLYPYKRCRSQKVTPLVWRRCCPQPPRIEQFNPLASPARTSRMNFSYPIDSCLTIIPSLFASAYIALP